MIGWGSAFMVWCVIGGLTLHVAPDKWPFVLVYGVVGLIDAIVNEQRLKKLETAFEDAKRGERVFTTEWAEKWRKRTW